ncbi:hypothetical protein ZEAMMB73_Zm00001d006834 [Zea mays]|uniref:Uncharacterized protein n=1 Tax=Zea mays TaxID=4577 RepID=A0A1D6F139_MAIZE|nr:hypothetical protein ZEAMMB73_Zm00001d006834 [Zea mays]
MLAYLLHAPATAVAVAAAPCASYLRSLPPAKTPFLPSLPRPVSPRRAAAAFAFSPAAAAAPIAASLLQGPVLVWAGRLCIYYALLHVGLAGSPRNPFLSHGNTREVRRGGVSGSGVGRGVKLSDAFVLCRDRRRGRRRGQRPRVLQMGREAPWRRLR